MQRAQRAFSTALQSSQALRPNPLLQFIYDGHTMPDQNSLAEEFPGVPRFTFTTAAPLAPAEVTKLPSGLTVVTQDGNGAVASVGLHFAAGSRYEEVAGTTHLLEHAAFSGTHHRTALKLFKDAEDMGGEFSAATSREEFVYSGEVLRSHAGAMVELLAEAATASTMRPYHIEELKHAVFEEAVEDKATSTQSLLLEGLHAGAYGGGAAGPGRRLWAEEGDLPSLTSGHLLAHTAANFTAGNAVLAAYNVPHSLAVEAAGRYLGGLGSGTRPAPLAPVWRGGDHALRAARDATSASMALAFPAPPAGATGAAAAAQVLAALLGGTSHRGPNRTGFPGLSRLARAAEGAPPGAILRAFYLPGRDGGMLGVWGSVEHAGGAALLQVLAGAAKSLRSGSLSAEELARAKAAAKLRLALALEERAGVRSALGSAALRTGSAGDSLAAELARIDAVSAGDVAALAASALKAQPAVASIMAEEAPRYEAVKAALA